MTVPATTRRAGPFTGNGVTTGFPFAFKVFTTADLAVVRASDGVENTLALGTDYTVSLNPDQDTSPGGTVNLTAPLATGDTLAIVGDIDYDQQLDLPGGGAFRPLALENALDRMVIQIQQLREEVERTLRVPVTSDADIELPAAEASKLIGWDSGATGLQNYDVVDLVSAQLYADWTFDTFNSNGTATSFALQGAPGSLGNIDVSIDGVTQVPGVDYAVSGSTLTFTSAPPNGTEILARYGSSAVQGVLGFTTEYKTATAGQTVFTLTNPYTPGGGNLKVYVNGLAVRGGVDYLETNTTTVTFTTGLSLNDEVRFEVGGTTNAAAAASQIGYQPAGANAVARTVQARLGDVFNVKDYGAVGDGVTNDTLAIQRAITDAQAQVANRFTGPGVSVVFPRGTYLITSTLVINTSNVYLVGESPGSAMLYAPSSNFDLVHFDGSSLALYSVGMLNMRTYTPGNATAGAHIRVRRTINAIFDNIQCIGWYDGIVSDGAAKTYYSNVIMGQANRTPSTAFRYALYFASTTNNNSDVHVSNFQATWDLGTQPNSVSMRVDGSDGIYFTNGHQYGSTVLIPSSTTCASVQWSNWYFDTSVDTNVSFHGTSTTYRNFHFANCYFRNSGGTGLQFNASSNVNRVMVSNCQFSSHRLYGVHCISNVVDATITGCVFQGNNTDNSSGAGDLLLSGEVTVVGNRFIDGGAAGRAIRLAAGATDCIVALNSLVSSTAGTKISNIGSNNAIRGNTGYVQKAEGTATISNPATSVVVNHGLAVTPSASDIDVALTADAAGVTRWWVSSITPTSFTINANATPTTSAAFAWKADAED